MFVKLCLYQYHRTASVGRCRSDFRVRLQQKRHKFAKLRIRLTYKWAAVSWEQLKIQ